MRSIHSLLLALAAASAAPAWSQNVISDDFTQAVSNNSWYFFNGACLTAGTGTSVASPGPLPGCSTILGNYYTNTTIEAVTNSNGTDWYDKVLVGGQNGVAPAPAGTCTQGADPKTQCGSTVGTLPDPVGSGALRFTNGAPYGYYENGAIISSTPFNTGQGLQVTFKTVTYRGNGGGAGYDGADGIGFFLMDASKGNPANGIGSIGGSLGYSCSNVNGPGDGLVGGYLGLGIDEFGNFMNGNTNLFTGTNPSPGYTILHGDNGASGYGYYPNRIGLRGAGSVSWAYLHSNYGSYYPNSLTAIQRQYAVNWTCILGKVLNFQTATPGNPNNAATTVPTAVSPQPAPAVLDYAPIAYTVLPNTIAAETAWARPNGVPLQYNLKITQNGLLSLSYSYNGAPYAPVINAYNIASSNGSLPTSLYFGFAGSTGGSTNIHEILCFKAGPPAVSSSSASVNEKQTSEVQTTSQAYFSFYDPNDFTGRVAAYPLIDSAGVVSVGSTANWDSECELTGLPAGQTCLTTGATGAIAAQSPASRVMLTWNGVDTALLPGTSGIPFEWPTGSSGGITTAEQAIIDAGDALPLNGNRVNYLRGVRTNEINSSGVGLYRARDGVLADIVDSSPTWVGPPSSPFTLFWRDRYDTTDSMLENTGTQTYATYKSVEQGRLNVVYVGANDGFLHGFRTGSEDAQGNVINNATTPNDGAEVLAYMPGAVLNTIHSNATPTIDFANAQYQHNFYVDATPGTGDLFFQGAWHTWLVGGLGAGGAALYALDITDPLNQPFAENNASGIVMGEWSSATITCVGNTACGGNLGNTYGTPLIRRFHNGMWGAIFGNGYGSATGDAGIYVMIVDQTQGASNITFYYLSTGSGTATSPGSDGIAAVTSADLDGDHITDYVYAGDLKGKVWRFDLTSTNPASWAVTSGGPLFTTGGQPITEPVIVASVYAANPGTPQIMIGFGTGQRTQFTNSSAATYVAGTQALYGIWDTNFTAWNTNSPATFLALTGAPATETIANLQQQTLSLNTTTGLVTTSNTTVAWATSCASSCNGKLGWYANLNGTSGATNVAGAALTEQIVSPPGLYQSAFIVNSAIPANNSILSCSATSTDGGVTYALNLATGGTFAAGTTSQSAFVAYKNTTTVGVLSNETGSLAIVNTKEGTTFMVGQLIAPTITSSTSNGVTTLTTNIAGKQQIGLPPNVKYSRQTWVELR
jgi:type IV pilus assembly protein PilY1